MLVTLIEESKNLIAVSRNKMFQEVCERHRDEITNADVVKIIIHKPRGQKVVGALTAEEIEQFKTMAEIQAERRKLTPQIKATIALRDDFRCQFCGKQLRWHEVTVDHILPLCRGGKTDIENLQILCSHCNSQKGSKDVKKMIITKKEQEDIKNGGQMEQGDTKA